MLSLVDKARREIESLEKRREKIAPRLAASTERIEKRRELFKRQSANMDKAEARHAKLTSATAEIDNYIGALKAAITNGSESADVDTEAVLAAAEELSGDVVVEDDGDVDGDVDVDVDDDDAI